MSYQSPAAHFALCLLVVLTVQASFSRSLPAQNDSAESTAPAVSADSELPQSEPSDSAPAPTPQVLSDDTVLPWNRPAEEPISPPTKRLSSPREMLNLFSIDDSQIDQLVDRRPLVDDEQETLLKILYRIPYFGADKMYAWCRTDQNWADLVEVPELYRLDVFHLRGQAVGVQRLPLPLEAADRFEFSHYYLVQFQLDDASIPVQICCREIPEAWRRRDGLHERASAYGLFLKVGKNDDGESTLVFGAHRVAWMPDSVQPDAGITADHVLLGDLGMDVGLLDDVRKTNRRELEGEDRECFYQMLAATGRDESHLLFQHGQRPFDVEATLTRPEEEQGRLFSIKGTARRVQRIVVAEDDIRERFGIDHYYQIDVFVPLGDEEVRLGTGDLDEAVPVFRNSYPVTCCVLELPPGLPQGDDVSVTIQTVGFYFKLWAYRSEYVSSFDSRQRQISPMFVAATPRPVEVSYGIDPVWGWILGGAFLIAALCLATSAWFFRRGDRQFEQARLRREAEAGDIQSLDQLASQVPDSPDFSGLEEERKE